MITIRVATAADAELIAGMGRHTFYETFASQNTKGTWINSLNVTFAKATL